MPARAWADHIGFGLPAAGLPTQGEVEGELSYVMGASMFVRRSVYERTGGMSEAYFLYFEEADWARRLPDGVRQTTCLAARVYHKEGGAIGTSSRSTRRPAATASSIVPTMRTRSFFDPSHAICARRCTMPGLRNRPRTASM